ncbi:hypothetical protein K437DRAFT_259398 [Tilletiaria anomala UBC 951]|uniref:Chromatin modification-related protein n=1 Tax=Tilletiaria anomala (strain ATCC 24038 / CBS 436.72 / UBC 951) TaxID=1037660 RepID=A0A066VI97_TILAU|nr:uncharacterized protein K437DRAFT_259398 [Tilletiaria anomala UBC 951]KDN38449.1 hypothetical protein K437DRAFT_259398 [Tilletiaria anomala UBC 951]
MPRQSSANNAPAATTASSSHMQPPTPAGYMIQKRQAASSSSAAAAPYAHLQHPPPSAQDLTLFTSLAAYADALDALPLDLTRSFSDLRELDAVLGAHISSLTARLAYLTSLIEDPNITPGERLVALKEVAEEARAYKMGGEDKIRVAVNTAEIIVSHTDYIDSLLDNLNSVHSLSPYLDPVAYLRGKGIIPSTLNPDGLVTALGGTSSYRGGGVAGGSGAGSMSGYYNGAASESLTAVNSGKKSRKTASGATVAGGGSAVAQGGASASDRRSYQSAATARDVSLSAAVPALSASAGTSVASKKRKAPGGAASSSSAAKTARADQDDAVLRTDKRMAKSNSRTAHSSGVRSAEYGDALDHQDGVSAAASRLSGRGRNARASSKLDTTEDEGEGNGHAMPLGGYGNEVATFSRRGSRPPAAGSSGGGVGLPGASASDGLLDGLPRGHRISAGGPTGPDGLLPPVGGHTDGSTVPPPGFVPEERRYCYCNQFSFGEMIGCDDDDCEREWFHIDCVGLEKPPSGTWYCEECSQRRQRKAKKGKNGTGGSGRSGRK